MAALLERTKKYLRSVLIHEQYGVAVDMLERDYDDLVSVLQCPCSTAVLS